MNSEAKGEFNRIAIMNKLPCSVTRNSLPVIEAKNQVIIVGNYLYRI